MRIHSDCEPEQKKKYVILVLGLICCFILLFIFDISRNKIHTEFPNAWEQFEAVPLHEGTIVIRSDMNSSQKLDTQGAVCDMLDFPAVKMRSTALINSVLRSAPAHTLVVLAYFLDKLGRDNLQFFLAQGLVPESAYHYVVVINGNVSETWTARLHTIAELYPNFE